jgi:rod shape determining protein RodA
MAVRNKLWANIDWVTVFLFLALVFLGWLNIYASVYSEDHNSLFDFTQRYGKQFIWIVAALVIGLIILFIETNFYVFFAYIIYGAVVFLLILVLFAGSEINGSKSWFTIGSMGFQPSEIGKFATGLALAKYMSSYGFKLQRFQSIITVAAIIFVPVVFILLQNDTGSALVFSSFILVLYREGLSGVVLFFATLALLIFVLALVLPNTIFYLVLLTAVLLAYLLLRQKIGHWLNVLIMLGATVGLMLGLNTALPSKFDEAGVLLFASVIGGIIVLGYSIRKKLKNYIIISLVFIGSVFFSISVDFVFSNVLEPYHQSRINELLGIVSDPLGVGYNVNQSKIAIGSGGFWGKGFLNGTQTKFNFVPEQSTDFIFCTVGEEWGFVGSLLVIGLFLFLLVRLIILAERQRSRFSRIYGYSVAVILFFHFMVNVGMTIGLMPVIGIPLPFFSYGGSSLWSFTILLFVFIRLDASRLEHLSD